MDSVAGGNFRGILKDQIKNFGQEAEVTEVGQVLSVGDGYRPRRMVSTTSQAVKWVEFENGTRGMALNLETDNVGIVFSAPTARSRKARPSSAPAPSSIPRSARACSPRRRLRSAIRSTQGPDPGD